jgi:hypothetical protein
MTHSFPNLCGDMTTLLIATALLLVAILVA